MLEAFPDNPPAKPFELRPQRLLRCIRKVVKQVMREFTPAQLPKKRSGCSAAALGAGGPNLGGDFAEVEVSAGWGSAGNCRVIALLRSGEAPYLNPASL